MCIWRVCWRFLQIVWRVSGTLCSILDSKQIWKFSKFQLARGSYNVALFWWNHPRRWLKCIFKMYEGVSGWNILIPKKIFAVQILVSVTDMLGQNRPGQFMSYFPVRIFLDPHFIWFAMLEKSFSDPKFHGLMGPTFLTKIHLV